MPVSVPDPRRGVAAGGVRLVMLCVLLTALPAEDWTVTGPLVALRAAPPGSTGVAVATPAELPPDAGLVAWLRDRHGRWLQGPWTPLRPGTVQELRLPRSGDGDLRAEPWPAGVVLPAAAADLRCGLAFASATAQAVRLRLAWHRDGAVAQLPPDAAGRLRDLELPGYDGRDVRLRTGQAWALRCQPDPLPADPFALEAFSLHLELVAEDGASERAVAFHRQPMRLIDCGASEEARPEGQACWELRWRPRRPGRYRAALIARWDDGEERRWPLPDLQVAGAVWDDYLRIDPARPDALVTGLASGAPRSWWAPGLNLHSVWDERCRDRTATRLTPDRGWHAYEAYLRRCAAAGIGVVEIWLASWNLALEWRGDWRGHGGLGRYHLGNAERLDRILDLAEQLGIRVVLVLRNHGQASAGVDQEWNDNPYNAALRRPAPGIVGGPAADPEAYFTDPRALALQDRLRAYVAARWSSHPAILTWKLCTEIDLTSASTGALARWHARAAADWRRLDAYGHPIASHWSGDWRRPDPAIAGLPGIDLLTIDAYHGNEPERLICDVLWEGLHAPGGNLSRYGKPVIVTEYGGSSEAAPLPRLAAEQAAAPWCGLISGYAAGPMSWWHEDVDQRGRWASSVALAAFLAHADPAREGEPRSRLLRTGDDAQLWAACRYVGGLLQAWCVDRAWLRGEEALPVADGELLIGSAVAAGTLELSWWDCVTPAPIAVERVEHPGGALRLRLPPFSRHCALGLRRQR